MIKSSLEVTISMFLKSSNIRSYLDRRLLGGLKDYYVSILKEKDNMGYIKTGNGSVDKFISNTGQGKVENILKKYSKCSGSDDSMKFITSVVVTALLAHLKVHEISIYLSGSSRENIGLSDTFVMKLQSSVDLVDDLDSDFDSYLNIIPSKGDLRYLDIGLKRLLATEVDKIV